MNIEDSCEIFQLSRSMIRKPKRKENELKTSPKYYQYTISKSGKCSRINTQA